MRTTPRKAPLAHRYEIPRAELRDEGARSVVLGLLAAVAAQLAVKHVADLAMKFGTDEALMTVLWTLLFAIITLEVGLGARERPFVITTADQQQRLDLLKVVVNIPVHNECEIALDRALWSLTRQTRVPDVVHVVDDGSTTSRYEQLSEHWAVEFAALGVDFRWTRTPNQLKRRAQMLTFSQPTDPTDPREEILVTLDSDTALDVAAIEEGLKPFADPGVASVAGFELAYNMYERGLLTMVGAMAQNIWQLGTCAALSTTGRVQVNRGTLAFYRSVVFRDRPQEYLDERWFGRRVEFSDDSRATLTAQRHGRTVQQPSCFQFTLTPVSWQHILRQRVRWMRGSQLRDVSRLRELPWNCYAYWLVYLKWFQFGLASVAVALAAVTVEPTREQLAYVIGMPLLLAYLCALRYLMLRRSDESLGQQLLAVAVAPLVVLRSATVFKLVRLYALITFLKVQTWGTRGGVEVTAGDGAARAGRPSLIGVEPR